MNSAAVRRNFALIDRQHADAGEALHVVIGTPAEHRRLPIGTPSIGFSDRGTEVYRMRTASHLYDERDVEVTLELERTIATRMGLLLADCHACRTTVHVEPDADACPTCRTAF